MVPSHIGHNGRFEIAGNEEADEEARRGALASIGKEIPFVNFALLQQLLLRQAAQLVWNIEQSFLMDGPASSRPRAVASAQPVPAGALARSSATTKQKTVT